MSTKKEKQPLSITHPELAKEADGWDPANITSGSNKKLSWKCAKKHTWDASVANRSKGRNCPFCSHKKLLPGFNDLATLFPEIADEAHGWDPRTVFGGTGNKLAWKCKQGHIYIISPNTRTSQKTGCAICSGKKLLTGCNDLQTLFPEIATEADGWEATNVLAGNRIQRKWKCPIGHQFMASPSSRTGSKKTGCPVCAGKRIVVGFNDLESKFPELSKEADGWDPKTVFPGTDVKKNWKCKNGHKYKANVVSRTNLNTGCPVCSNRSVLPGFNDLKSILPELAEEADGWDPSEFTVGSQQKMKWRCQNGHTYVSSIAHRTSKKGTGCPRCGKFGFDATKKGFLYLLENIDLEMLQIGITNDPERRFSEHLKRKWSLIEYRGPMDGNLTKDWETAILRMLKAKGADLSNEKIAGKFDGYSEAWSKSTFEVKSIKELMKITEEFEESTLKKKSKTRKIK